MIFADRAEAGRKLAQRLLHLKDRAPVVLALVRGGLPVGGAASGRIQQPADLCPD